MEKEKIVYNDIEESKFFLEYKDFTLYFSSAFYLRNFKLRFPSFLREETFKLKNRYKIINNEFIEFLEEILIIAYYKKVEKRGFRVYKNDERYIEKGD